MPWFHRRIIQGEPLRVGEKEIVPEAQVTWWMRRRGIVGMDSLSGWGALLVRVRPTAVIERSPGSSEGGRRIPIYDETTRLLLGLVAGAVFVLFLAQIAERLAKGGSK
jgi:hypothetical protein